MKIYFENRMGYAVENPNTDSHEAINWYYDVLGHFHLVLKKKGD